jgi:urea carboxylase-associated protein 1
LELGPFRRARIITAEPIFEAQSSHRQSERLVMAGIVLEGAGVTDEERAERSRAIAAERRAQSMKRLAEVKARGGSAKLGRALHFPGTTLSDCVLEPGPYSRVVRAGDHLRIVDLEGQQAVDFLVYDAANHANRYNAANTIKLNRSIYIGAGFKLYSDLGDVLMTVVEDTVGYHDTIGGCCSAESNYARYGIKGTESCRANFIAALAEHSMNARDIPANINWFMYVPVKPDGSTEIVDGRSEPGDYVDLRAERDVLVVISNCPQRYNPCNGWNPTPVRIIEWHLKTTP